MASSDAELTLVSALSRLRRGPGRGFRFVTSKNEEHYYAYEAIEAEAHRRAAHFAALDLKKGDRLAIVVTEPLTTNEAWTPLAANELTVFVDGALVVPAAAKQAAKKRLQVPVAA